jgi:hypothetical protein
MMSVVIRVLSCVRIWTYFQHSGYIFKNEMGRNVNLQRPAQTSQSNEMTIVGTWRMISILAWDELPEDSANFPNPDVLALGIAEELEANCHDRDFRDESEQDRQEGSRQLLTPLLKFRLCLNSHNCDYC